MNIAKSFEQAVRDALSASSSLPNGARVVAWQTPAETDGWNIPDAPPWSEEVDRYFPCIDVRCTPPAAEDGDETALTCDVAMLCATKVAADRDRSVIASLYELAQDFADGVAFARYAGDATAFQALAESLARREPRILLGGCTLGQPTPPSESGGLYLLGVTLTFHFSIDHP